MHPTAEVRFDLSTGLKKPLVVPLGTLAAAQAHVGDVEEWLGLRAEQGSAARPARWYSTTPTTSISDEVFCNIALEHSQWLDGFWQDLQKWAATPPGGNTEILTLEGASTFWHGLVRISVPVERWSREYYFERMKSMYKIMRGEPVEGIAWGGSPLSIKQASGVLWLVEQWLGVDPGDQRLEAPREWRWCAKTQKHKLVQLDLVERSGSYDGDGYEWCEHCGPVTQDNGDTGCPRSAKRCPIKRSREG